MATTMHGKMPTHCNAELSSLATQTQTQRTYPVTRLEMHTDLPPQLNDRPGLQTRPCD